MQNVRKRGKKMAFTVNQVKIGREFPLVIISGPCVIESETHAIETAGALKKMFDNAGVQLIYKSSYDKANRSSIDSYRGPGIEEGLRILQKVKEKWGLPILTDIHAPSEAERAAKVCDILQIPAFLCRQTDLLIAAAQTGKIVNVKKGQFMAAQDMAQVTKKMTSTGNNKIILTERGNSFGYNNLVSDMRNIPILQNLGFPVCFDASHSVQLPGGRGDSSGGEREFIPPLAKAAIAAGADLLFIESHNEPQKAKSDKDSVISFDALKKLLKALKPLHHLIQQGRL